MRELRRILTALEEQVHVIRADYVVALFSPDVSLPQNGARAVQHELDRQEERLVRLRDLLRTVDREHAESHRRLTNG